MAVAETTKALYGPVYIQNGYLFEMQMHGKTFRHVINNYGVCLTGLGSIDDKHIRIKKFGNTGSRNFNYKGYFSVQLMACADADGCLIRRDLGRNSDGGVFRSSRLGRWLQADGLNLPPPEPLPLDENEHNFPYYFSAADEAFPLKTYIMRPYPRSSLTDKQRVFNFRLSLGRKTVECAFGMLTSKFRVFETPIG